MSRTYTLVITVKETGGDWWAEVLKNESSGCDEVLKEIIRVLAEGGFPYPAVYVKLVKFEDP